MPTGRAHPKRPRFYTAWTRLGHRGRSEMAGQRIEASDLPMLGGIYTGEELLDRLGRNRSCAYR